MALTIANIQRPQNCGHMVVTADVDGVSRSAHVHIDDAEAAVKAAGLNEQALLVCLWIWYRRKIKGETFASMIGKVVA